MSALEIVLTACFVVMFALWLFDFIFYQRLCDRWQAVCDRWSALYDEQQQDVRDWQELHAEREREVRDWEEIADGWKVQARRWKRLYDAHQGREAGDIRADELTAARSGEFAQEAMNEKERT
jgi:hypothetical protein